ncbi:fatty acid--CoA ligase [Oleomonas cavernae]|uniref:3-methylmercaptopropionyl-CoA ligase n=1 Tax=Oleomonas cavernae TaxID=2320859 RepID=A0A418W8Z7_9PROT|nr:AMP-binding protein [Oleomonas cavernae]RJF86490.1 fatty acid--CoA ligase [Oleomonas cavernae]
MTLSSLSDVYRLQDPSWADRPAVTMGDAVLTFGALDRLSNRIARALIRDGVVPGARVAILDKNSLVYPALIGGILKAGGVALPINFRLVMDEVAFTLEDGDAGIVFVGPDHLALAAGLVERLPHLVLVDVADGLEAWLGDVGEGDPDIRRGGEAEIVQLYTSGTTGRPKGVCHTDIAYCAITEAFGRHVGLPAAGKEMLVLVPLFHLAGFDLATFALAHGIGIVLQRDVDAAAALKTIEARRIAALMVVPTVIQMLVDAQGRAGADLGSLERIYYGASSIPEPLLVRALKMTGGVGFTQCYGMSETNIITALRPADHADSALLASCGRPLPGCAVRIADADGREVPAGELGEVTVKAPWLMPRYWKRPEATRETFRDGWLRTGDAGSVDERGFLFIRDRIKDLIITGGENVYPAEVERVLIEHPALVEVAVFGVPDARWGESVRAAVVPRAGESVTEAELLAFVAGRIARYKQPKSITILGALPRNASGKVLKFRLREEWQNAGLATGT